MYVEKRKYHRNKDKQKNLRDQLNKTEHFQSLAAVKFEEAFETLEIVPPVGVISILVFNGTLCAEGVVTLKVIASLVTKLELI